MMRKVILLLLAVLVAMPVYAGKKKEFSLSREKKFKPQNLSIIKRQWSSALKQGKPSKRYYPETSEPVVENGIIYVGTHGKSFYAVSEDKGNLIWQYKNEEAISSTAGLSQDRVVFADLGGNVICLNKSDGSEIWKRYQGSEILGRPLVLSDAVYVLSGEQRVVALSLADGHELWTKQIRTYVRDITMRGHSSLVADSGSLYVGLADGHLYRMSMKDGTLVWEKNLTIPLRTFKDIDANVVVEGDSLYVGGYSGAFYRLNKTTGAITWSVDVATGTAPIILNHVVIVSDADGGLIGIDKDQGTQLWYNDLASGVLSAPQEYDGKVFVTAFESSAFLIDPENGYQVQKLGMGDGSINKAGVLSDHLYVLTNGAKLVALGK